MAQWRKVVVSGSSAALTSVTTDGAITAGTSFVIGSADINETDLEKLDGITNGTAAASKAVVLDSNKDIGTIRNLTIDGVFTDGNYTFDTSGNVSGLGTVSCGAITSTGTLSVTGDLDVTGTVTTINSTNLAVADKFALFASGSTAATDGGIVVQNSAEGTGYALGYDVGMSKWAFQNNLAHDASVIAPDAYVGVIETGTDAGDSQSAPVYGGATNGVGTIYIDTDDSEIWIYA